MSYQLTGGIPLTTKPRVDIYCDGAYFPSDGWSTIGAILFCEGRNKRLVEQVDEVNSSRAEMRAALLGLDYLTRPCHVRLFSDHISLIEGMTINDRYIHHPVNRVFIGDLWRRLDKHALYHGIEWQHQRGHCGNRWIDVVHNMINDHARHMRKNQKTPGA